MGVWQQVVLTFPCQTALFVDFLPSTDEACDKTSDHLFSTLVLVRAPSNDEFNFQKSLLDGAVSKRGVENKRSEVLYLGRYGAVLE